jgi:probable rRNA maturation factor
LSVFFHSTDISFILKRKNLFKKWIYSEINLHSCISGEINIIFCSDKYLLKINRDYLNHDYYTDIITFNYNTENIISGDLYISLERVMENSSNFNTDLLEEISRVIIHGILHLFGYDDDSEKRKSAIHKLEDEAINRFKSLVN